MGTTFKTFSDGTELRVARTGHDEHGDIEVVVEYVENGEAKDSAIFCLQRGPDGGWADADFDHRNYIFSDISRPPRFYRRVGIEVDLQRGVEASLVGWIRGVGLSFSMLGPSCARA